MTIKYLTLLRLISLLQYIIRETHTHTFNSTQTQAHAHISART